MFDLVTILGGAALVNNFVLVQLLGLCPFMGVSNRLATALPMGIATTFVITISTLLTNLLNKYLLIPYNIEFLRLVLFITVIAGVVQLTERYIKYTSKLLHQVLGIYLPLITSNCAILGVVLTVADLSLLQSLAVGAGSAIGFTLVLVLFSGLRARLDEQSIPRVFRGAPIAFITVGMLALAFLGFKGML
ncbi:MAG: electron transport complex subunit RsxA [Gammaproteobacteria bacterium]|nr:electron transport complex subunit RsxA [Gammaproteobacteria bacterium]MYF38094.1 electron transport complex subunit RsxA [Gammaproteobacteria bacterium]